MEDFRLSENLPFLLLLFYLFLLTPLQDILFLCIQHQLLQESELIYIICTLLWVLLMQAIDNLIGSLILSLLDVDSSKGFCKDSAVIA